MASPLEQNINVPTTGNTPILSTHHKTTMVPQNANVQNSQQINAANPLGVPLNQQTSQQTVFSYEFKCSSIYTNAKYQVHNHL